MNKNLFKFISEKTCGNNPLLAIINEEMVQSLTEPIIERELSDIELNRFCCAAIEDETINHLIVDLIREVTDEDKIDWSDTDKTFLDRLPKEERERCLKEKLDLESESDKLRV